MSNNPYLSHISPTSTGNAPVPAPEPNEAPPPYMGSPSSSAVHPSQGNAHDPSHLDVPSGRPGSVNSTDDEHDPLHELGIPVNERVSMEEESRELPKGWIRVVDPATEHIFYVDERASPPRSSWVHPYDDPEYLSSLPDTDPAVQWHREATRQEQGIGGSAGGAQAQGRPTSSGGAGMSSSNENAGKNEKRTFGRKLKDKLTASTHEQRESQRKTEKDEAKKQHAAYLARREQMLQAQRDGQYSQYSLPPGNYPGPGGDGGMNAGYPGSYGNQYGYQRGGYYGRRGYGYGGGYGGMYGGGMGMGMPLMLGGGLLGGALLGGALGGGGYGGYGGYGGGYDNGGMGMGGGDMSGGMGGGGDMGGMGGGDMGGGGGDMGGVVPVPASCYCGAIEYTIDDDQGFKEGGILCHCKTCQKLHTQNSYNIKTKRDALKVIKGKTTVYEDKKGDSGKSIHRNFCPSCGCHLWSVPDFAPDALFVKVGPLSNADTIKPVASIYVESALPHSLLNKGDGVAQFEGFMAKQV